GPKEIRPLWDNTVRVNHQNKLNHPHPKRNFVSAAVLTKSGKVPVNGAKQSSHRAAISVSAARRVNTAASRLNVNNALPTTYSYFKAHSSVRRPFNQKSATKTNNFNEKVNTVKVNNVTTAGPKAVVRAVKGNRNNDQGIFDSGCSRHMTRNKSYLINYQEIDGEFVAFGGNAKGGPKRTQKMRLLMMLEKKVLKFQERRMEFRIQQKKVTKMINRRILEIKKMPLQNNVNKNLKDCLVKGRLLTLTTLIDLILLVHQLMLMFTLVSDTGSTYINLSGSIPVNAATLPNADLHTDPLMPNLEDTADLQDSKIFSGAYDDEVKGAVDDFNNLELTTFVSVIPTTRIHKDHPKEQIIRDPLSAPQTRRMTKTSQEHAMVNYIKKQRRTNHKDYQNCLFACFLSQIEPTKVYRNKKDERGIVVRNKSRLVAQGYTHEDGINYDEVFAPVARIEAIRGIINKTLFIKKDKEFEGLMHKKFQMSSLGELTFFLGLQVMQRDDRNFISQDKYVVDILKKFNFSLMKTASTPIETNKALLKDEETKDVDIHLYRSMIGSLMYLIASKPHIIFAVCACARFQVTPKVSHLYAVNRIFRYLKVNPNLAFSILRIHHLTWKLFQIMIMLS
nr:ribonuclease H-like domain, reverse transcriptase, RNA-dependent DNA polymerase [Tanacetum cinerariifolium]